VDWINLAQDGLEYRSTLQTHFSTKYLKFFNGSSVLPIFFRYYS